MIKYYLATVVQYHVSPKPMQFGILATSENDALAVVAQWFPQGRCTELEVQRVDYISPRIIRRLDLSRPGRPPKAGA